MKGMMLLYTMTSIFIVLSVSYAEQFPIFELDQDCGSGGASGWYFDLGMTMVAQSFVPDCNNVGAVRTLIDSWPSPMTEIRPDDGGFPSDIVLGSSTEFYEYIWNTVIFDPPIQVTPGQTYHIVSYITPGESGRVMLYRPQIDNSYPYGQAYHTDENGDWVAGFVDPGYATRDHYFRTYAMLGYHQRPIADAGDDIIASADEVVVLDATNSYDDGSILYYYWRRLPHERMDWGSEQEFWSEGPTLETRALGYAEELFELTVWDNMNVPSLPDTVKIIHPGVQGPQGPQGEQGPPGITPEEITVMQKQITVLQQIVEQNRKAMERFKPLKKLLEEQGAWEGIAGDVNNDGKVDFSDWAILSEHWLEGNE